MHVAQPSPIASRLELNSRDRHVPACCGTTHCMADRATSAARPAITFSILERFETCHSPLPRAARVSINMTAVDMTTRPDRDTDCWRIASPQGSLPLDPSRDLARHPSPSPESRCKAEPPPPIIRRKAMSHSERFEILVLGSGMGGRLLAWHMALAGRRTAVVERRWIGGSCPNINCLPSKNEIWSAKVASLVRRSADYGANIGRVAIDMAKVVTGSVRWSTTRSPRICGTTRKAVPS
jgi:hypothetical protein